MDVKLDHKENWGLKNCCFHIVVLQKTLESHLDSKEIKSIDPKENQPWIFLGRTDAKAEAPILWPPEAKKWLTGKDPDAGKDWRQKQPRWPSADECIRKLWYIYTMEYYSAIKKNTFESVLMRWIKLEPIIQSEVSQKEKDQYSILTHIYGI